MTIDGEPWFVLADVARVLGLNEPHVVARRLDPDDRFTTPVIDRMGRKQRTTIINESGLNRADFDSIEPRTTRQGEHL